MGEISVQMLRKAAIEGDGGVEESQRGREGGKEERDDLTWHSLLSF